MTAPTDAPSTDATNETPAVNMATLESNLATAIADVNKHQAALVTAGQTNDIPEMVKAVKGLEAAQKAVTAAERAIERAGFEARSAERNAATSALKTAIELALADIDGANLVTLKITGATIVVNEDGSFNVSVSTKATPKPTAGGPRTSTVGGGRNQVHYQGGVYATREFVEAFGEDEDKAKLAAAYAWKERGLSHFPGIDGIVKGLVKRTPGAYMEKNGVQIEL